MAMLSLSASCIHLELSVAKSQRNKRPPCQQFSFSAAEKWQPEWNSTTHWLSSRSFFFARSFPGFESVITPPIRPHIPDDREGRRGPLSVRCKNRKRRRRNPQLRLPLPHTCRGNCCRLQVSP